jgi:hypothetical protein
MCESRGDISLIILAVSRRYKRLIFAQFCEASRSSPNTSEPGIHLSGGVKPISGVHLISAVKGCSDDIMEFISRDCSLARDESRQLSKTRLMIRKKRGCREENSQDHGGGFWEKPVIAGSYAR